VEAMEYGPHHCQIWILAPMVSSPQRGTFLSTYLSWDVILFLNKSVSSNGDLDLGSSSGSLIIPSTRLSLIYFSFLTQKRKYASHLKDFKELHMISLLKYS